MVNRKFKKLETKVSNRHRLVVLNNFANIGSRSIKTSDDEIIEAN